MTFQFETTNRDTRVTATIDYALPFSVLGMLIDKLMRLEKGFDSFLKKGLDNARKILEA